MFKPYKLTTYIGGAPARRLHFWRLVAPNGKIIADGAQGYATQGAARRAARRIRDMFDAGRVQVE